MFLRNTWITQPGTGILVPGAVTWLNGSRLVATPKKSNPFTVGTPTTIKTAQGESFNYSGGQYVVCDTNVLPTQPKEVTLIALVRLNNKTDSQNFIGINDTTLASTLFRIYYTLGSDRFSFQIRDAGGSTATNCDGTTSPVVGVWYVVIGTYTAARQRIYVNGVLEASTSVSFSGLSFDFTRVNCGAIDRGGALQYLNGALPFAAVYPREFTQSEIAQLRTPKDVWKLFSPPSRRLWNSLGGANTYTLSVSGGVTFSGAIPLLRERRQVPSGGINFSGSIPLLRTRTQVPSGGITFGGTAPIIFNAPNIYTIIPSGGVTFSGTTPLRRERLFAPSGAVSFSGAAPLIRTRVTVPSGQVTFSGSAPIVFIPAGGVPYVPTSRVSVGSARSARIS